MSSAEITEIGGVENLQPLPVAGIELAALAVAEKPRLAGGTWRRRSGRDFFQPSSTASIRAGQRLSSMCLGLQQLASGAAPDRPNCETVGWKLGFFF